jgi:hypothetical protein
MTEIDRPITALAALQKQKPRFVQIGGRNFRRIIAHPKPVNDGTCRCIQCGQIDDEPWHDSEICAEAGRSLRAILAAQEQEQTND